MKTNHKFYCFVSHLVRQKFQNQPEIPFTSYENITDIYLMIIHESL